MEQSPRPITHVNVSEDPGAPPLLAAIGGVLGTLLTGAPCIVPLLAISLGVSGFGWVTYFSRYRVPSTIMTFILLGCGFYWAYRSSGGAKLSRCMMRRARVALWFALVFAICINAFEYFLYAHLI